GTRSETKNLNSFRSVEKAVEFEVQRQIELLEQGERIVQETRGWDDDRQITLSQRSKENADDYRYMPDPDLAPIVLTEAYIADIKKTMPELPDDLRTKFAVIAIDAKVTEDLIAIPPVARTVSRILDAASPEDAKRIAFWLLLLNGEADENTGSETEQTIDDARLITLSKLVGENKLSSTAAKEVLAVMATSDDAPEKIAADKNLLQESDEGAIAAIVSEVLKVNAKAAEDVKNGEMKAIGFLVGQVMKQSQGKANPAMAQELIKKQLDL
ncbi:MAG: Asp-tRNA(Asn)/Glu-tRNA(Gln) amidotransferase subunit GatB, partial [Patescibacteria group bacterium]|nr:Asp-tRNA(Asn)/Glu-tRNA(Gln) amidotransferase subunit GatB [Patescibacteria group bacterium]